MAQLNDHVSWWWKEMARRTNNDELTLVTFVITFAIVILGVLWYKKTISSPSNGAKPLPPGPRSLPIVGYLPFLKPDLHRQFTDLAQTYGPIFKTYFGNKLYIVISDPELAKVVFRDQDDNFSNRNPGIAPSIVSYEGQDVIWAENNSKWRNLRRIFVQKVLSNKNLQECSSFRRNEVRKTIKNVFNKIGTNININEISFSTEANVLTSMVWGNSSLEKSENERIVAELHTAITRIFGILEKPNVSDFIPILAWLDLQGIVRDTKKEFQRMDQIFTLFINDRIESISKRPKDAVPQDGKKDLLEILLELNAQKDATSLSITQIKALLTDTMAAGTDTTTTLIEWAMTEILKNPSILKSVQEELENVVGANNMVEESHLPQLKYLDATVKETFRLHPIFPLGLPRSPNQTCTVGGYTIPKGCTVFVNTWAIQRDPRYWDNPLEFKPERFLTNEEGTNKWDFIGKNMKFLPFGSGRRLCPGYPLAEKMQMYILASLLHSFNWTSPNGEEHDLSERFGLTLRKTNPLLVMPSQKLSDMSLYMK